MTLPPSCTCLRIFSLAFGSTTGLTTPRIRRQRSRHVSIWISKSFLSQSPLLPSSHLLYWTVGWNLCLRLLRPWSFLRLFLTVFTTSYLNSSFFTSRLGLLRLKYLLLLFTFIRTCITTGTSVVFTICNT